MEQLNLMALMKLSIVMPILFVCSVFLVGYALERFVCFMRHGNVPPEALEAVKALQRAERPIDQLERTIGIHRQKLQMVLGRRLGLFGTFSFIAPLLGLLGTVLGVIRAFRDLAVSGSGGPTVVAAGIAEALVATAAGIGVAITAALLYNYFTLRMRAILSRYDLTTQELLLPGSSTPPTGGKGPSAESIPSGVEGHRTGA